MNLPTLATLALVLAYPIGYAAYLSFHKVTPAELRRGVFPSVGLGNYERILSDPLFLLALKNTLAFTAVTVVVELALAIAIALLIDQRQIWTSRVSRFLILLPYAVSPAFTAAPLRAHQRASRRALAEGTKDRTYWNGSRQSDFDRAADTKETAP